MRRSVFILISVLFALLPLGAYQQQESAELATPSAQSMQGYTLASAKAEREWEQKFRAIPEPQRMREYMKLLSAHPHNVGTVYDKQNAEWILARFKEWGLPAEIETFDPLFPTPRERVVELVAPTQFKAKLQEPALAVDPTSNQQAEQLPTYNAYSADGDVTAPLVFVNYGLPADYERLERLGVDVKGAIVIAKYGNSWRGIKPKVAAEHGAVGCIIYSDPKDDGYFVDDVYPNGPMRPKDGVQRGSVLDMPLYPGDPLTPGVGAKPDTKRYTVKEAPTITKIPVLPISYSDAQPLLAALTGPVAPEEWRGGLPITYHVGPGAAKVHLRVMSNWDIKKVYDVVARIPGSTYPDEWVIRGNHHDGWVNGAEDPISGQVTLLEEARALGELLKQGWKPKRTIILCAWDGEEPMLLGSTEWAEYHADELKQHGAMYINSDVNDRGFIEGNGSHILEQLINDAAREVQDPEKKMTVWKRHHLADIALGDDDDRKDARGRANWRIGALGSGSDYTAFIDHLGVPSVDLRFEGETPGGIYHSIYDDFYWYTHFSDGDFTFGRALSQTAGTAIMRFADADVMPYEYTGLADTIGKYNEELKKLLKDRQEKYAEIDRELDEGAYDAAADPKHPVLPPKREKVPPFLNFAPLDNAENALKQSADHYARAMKAFEERQAELAPEQTKALNERLLQSERLLLNDQGLPRRPWFKHLIYAPGYYTGYGAKTIPGVREAIEEKRYDEAEHEISRVAKALQDEAALVEQAAGALEGLK